MPLSVAQKSAIKQVVNLRCEWCGKKFIEAVLHIHHINGNRDDNRQVNIIVLNSNDHNRAHSDDRRITAARLRERVIGRSERRKELIRDIVNPRYCQSK